MARASTIDRRALLTGLLRSEQRYPVSSSVVANIAVISDSCLAHAGVFCMSCRDACPQQAIWFRPRIGGPFLPEVVKGTCTGCGACTAPCPAQAIALCEMPGEAAGA